MKQFASSQKTSRPFPRSSDRSTPPEDWAHNAKVQIHRHHAGRSHRQWIGKCLNSGHGAAIPTGQRSFTPRRSREEEHSELRDHEEEGETSRPDAFLPADG